MNIIEALFELQDNHKKIDGCNKILKDGTYIYLLKKLKKEFEMTKTKYLEKNNEIAIIKKSYITIGKEIKELQIEIEETNEKLYNEASNDLQLLESLMEKVEDRKKRVKELEDYDIEMLEKEETLKEDVEKLRVELLNLKTNFTSYKELGNNKIKDANDTLKLVQEEVLKIKESLPQDVVYEFYKLLDAKGTAVVKLQKGICTGCRMKVSAITLDNILNGNGFVYCDNCGRLLLHVKDVDVK